MRAIIFSFVVIICLPGCATVPPGQAEGEARIVFGQGGGITGLRTEYTINESGHLWQRAAWTDSLHLLAELDAAFARQTFKNFTTLRLDTLTYNNPGDLYYFIEMHTAQGTTQTIVWGYPGFTPDPSLVRFYNNLYRTAKRVQQ